MITQKLFWDLRTLVRWAQGRMTECDGVNINRLSHDLDEAREYMAQNHAAVNAAPVMLKALEAFVNYSDYKALAAAKEQARAAIAQATAKHPENPAQRLYNCRTGLSPIRPGEYTSLMLGGCLTQSDNSGDFTLGGQRAADSEFFTVYGITPGGEAEAVTDNKDAKAALAVAAELAVLHELPATLSRFL